MLNNSSHYKEKFFYDFQNNRAIFYFSKNALKRKNKVAKKIITDQCDFSKYFKLKL